MGKNLQKIASMEAAAEKRAPGVPKLKRPRKHKVKLECDHPTGAAFLDESGAISNDRFFAVGCLLIEDPSPLLRGMQKLRDKHHWYKEIHWSEITHGTIPLYKELIELVVNSEARYSCFVSDRQAADPVLRFDRNPWRVYEKLATQLLIGSIRPYELVSVMADNYSAPDDVTFEQDVRAAVNKRLGRLAAINVCRMDSRACDGLQAVDVLTGAVTFEFRRAAGLAGDRSPKAKLADEARKLYGVSSVLAGVDTPKMNVKVYGNSGKAATGS